MIPDPIVEEIRAVRDEISTAYDYDIDAIFEAHRELARKDGKPRVSLPPRRPFAEAGQGAARPSVAADE